MVASAIGFEPVSEDHQEGREEQQDVMNPIHLAKGKGWDEAL